MLKKIPDRILLSRTDSIGDVILTLPMAGVLKDIFPETKILFLGQAYTKPVVMCSKFIDGFIDVNDLLDVGFVGESIIKLRKMQIDIIIHVFPKKEIASLARKSGIPLRIGSTGRLYHWLTCNRLVPLSRRKSKLHESQLNLKLLKLLGAKKHYTKEEIVRFYGFDNIPRIKPPLKQLQCSNRFNLILHPKSKGSAREWGLDRYEKLITILPADSFKIFITGTQEEGDLMKDFFLRNSGMITDLTGKLSLDELIGFIAAADGLVAASTGPLHIASALGKLALGIYPPIVPMHPGRWAPVGMKATYLVVDKVCSDCRNKVDCKCIREISPELVKDILMKEVL